MSVLTEKPIQPGPPQNASRGNKRSIKLVTCIVRGEKLQAVTEAVNKLNLVGGMTVADIRGVGHGENDTELYRGSRFHQSFAPKVKIELAIEANDLIEVENLVLELARTGNVGDGKMFVISIVDIMRIRTGEKGASAL